MSEGRKQQQYKDEIIDRNNIFDEVLAKDDKTHLFAVRISNQGCVIDVGKLTVNYLKDAIKKDDYIFIKRTEI